MKIEYFLSNLSDWSADDLRGLSDDIDRFSELHGLYYKEFEKFRGYVYLYDEYPLCPEYGGPELWDKLYTFTRGYINKLKRSGSSVLVHERKFANLVIMTGFLNKIDEINDELFLFKPAIGPEKTDLAIAMTSSLAEIDEEALDCFIKALDYCENVIIEAKPKMFSIKLYAKGVLKIE